MNVIDGDKMCQPPFYKERLAVLCGCDSNEAYLGLDISI